MSKEVEELLSKLGSMEDAPLIWINKKVGNLLEENKKMKKAIEKAQELIRDANSLNESEIDELSEILDSYRG